MKINLRSLGIGLLLFLFFSFMIFLFYEFKRLYLINEELVLWPVVLLALVLAFLVGAVIFFCFNSAKYISPVVPESGFPKGKDLENKNIFYELKKHLPYRYVFFWRRDIQIFMITGEPEAIDLLAPHLRKRLWLKYQHTILIYGGPLNVAPDSEKLIALRKLRRGRPLDGIIRVLGPGQTLTQQTSEADLQGLEAIGRLLRYQPPVWLWQLCASAWPQQGRTEQAVGISLPPRAMPEDIVTQFNRIVPQLREQGMAQVAENGAHDFLLRLAQQLEQGDSKRWKTRLTPWLYRAQQHVPLRGLVFSLAAPSSFQAETESGAALNSSRGLSACWQAIIADSMRVRGHRVGMAWEQTLGWALMAMITFCGAGLLLSFTFNRYQIITVAGKARELAHQPALPDAQLTALHDLRNDAGRLQNHVHNGAPWHYRFGLNHSAQLLSAMLPWYGAANNRLIRDPAEEALKQKLIVLINTAPDSDRRGELAKEGYDELKAWMMMARPDKADGAFFAQVMSRVQPARESVSVGLWQSLAPDLWRFYIAELPRQAQWKITPDSALVAQSRQVLLQQIGRRNAESTLYQNILQSVRRNFADVSLEDMTGDTEAHRLFSTDNRVPGMFTRQAWEGGILPAIEKAANRRRDEIDWVLSDSRSRMSDDITPEALKARLSERYFADFSASWLNFLNSLRWNPARNIADVTDQLTLMSDVRQSPVIALMNTLAWQGQTGEQREALSDSLIRSAKDLIGNKEKPVIDQQAARSQGPLDETFGPLLALMGKNLGSGMMSADNSLSLQTWLTRITRVRLRLQQIASASDPQERMQTLAQTVFQGKSVDLTDTQQYGSLMAASLGEEWSGFGNTLFVQPLTQAWETVLQPSAASLNDRWSRSVVASWRTAFDGRYPFAASKSDASLPMLAEFIRKDSGRIDRFLSSELNGVLHKEGSQWVPDGAHSQGLTFNPAFLQAINQLSQLSDILFTDGSQGISFELQPRPTAQVTETRLTIDGQQLRYFNQMADWQTFHWPGESYKPGAMLTWSSVSAGARLFGDYSGTWGFIRWLEQSKRQQLDRSQWLLKFTTAEGNTLQWVLRSQLGSGPLALLALRGFSLPDRIFSVDASPQALTAESEIDNNEGTE